MRRGRCHVSLFETYIEGNGEGKSCPACYHCVPFHYYFSLDAYLRSGILVKISAPLICAVFVILVHPVAGIASFSYFSGILELRWATPRKAQHVVSSWFDHRRNPHLAGSAPNRTPRDHLELVIYSGMLVPPLIHVSTQTLYNVGRAAVEYPMFSIRHRRV